jgi:predicted acylesterase/phospholipase RssA
MKMLLKIGVLFSMALLIISCGTTKKSPVEKISNAELAISRAQDNNAREFATIELRRAQDNLEQAKQAVQEEEFDKAERLAEQAFMDASLADEKAESEKANKSTKELRESVDTLKQEMERNR